MVVLGYKPGHDASVCCLDNGELKFCYEFEKGSYDRYSAELGHDNLIELLASWPGHVDAVAISGWIKGFHSIERPSGSGYFGHEANFSRFIDLPKGPLGSLRVFASSHERSHLFAAFALSDLPNGTPFYALVWEGNIGSFYAVDERMNIEKVCAVMEDPGNKYAWLFDLADPTFNPERPTFRFNSAGKMMALAGFGAETPSSPEIEALIDRIIPERSILLRRSKREYSDSPFYNIGHTHPDFARLAWHFSNAVYDRFNQAALAHGLTGRPLLISGGCGLNCEWNSQWRESGLFTEVFVPPCPNDAGSSIGTAAECQFAATGNAKVKWSVYAGPKCIADDATFPKFQAHPFDPAVVARLISEDQVFAIMQGRSEIGPRGLGNRSMLASPFKRATRDRLNTMKKREDYRPIAPVCTAEDVHRFFSPGYPSPYMLYFYRVLDERLDAIKHADNSARVQTVTAESNPRLYQILKAHEALTGVPVLCNTSLNFPGKGFMNSAAELEELAEQIGIDGIVVEDQMYLKSRSFSGG